jgi:hypothetical protein
LWATAKLLAVLRCCDQSAHTVSKPALRLPRESVLSVCAKSAAKSRIDTAAVAATQMRWRSAAGAISAAQPSRHVAATAPRRDHDSAPKAPAVSRLPPRTVATLSPAISARR